MPSFSKYSDEEAGEFAKRMSRKSKGGSIVKAAARFMQTAEQKKQRKGGSY